MRGLSRGVVCGLVALSARVAFGQAPPPPPPPPGEAPGIEVQVEPPSDYSQRPLLLPRGFEADLFAVAPSAEGVELGDYGMLDLRGRIALGGSAELRGGFELLGKQAVSGQQQTLSSIFAGARIAAGSNGAVALEAAAAVPLQESWKSFAFTGGYELKRSLTGRLSVAGLAGLRLEDIVLADSPVDGAWYVVGGRLELEIAVNLLDWLAVRGEGDVSVPLLAGHDCDSPEAYICHSPEMIYGYGGGAVLSLGRKIDLHFDYRRLSGVGNDWLADKEGKYSFLPVDQVSEIALGIRGRI